MNNCFKCGSVLAENALFCGKCGTQIKSAQGTQEKICYNCGNHMDASFRFCVGCGAPQNASKSPISVDLQKPKFSNKQFIVIALCVSIFLSLVLLPMFNLQSGYITVKDEFRAESDYTLKMLGDNYNAYTEYRDFSNTLTSVFFIMNLVALCAVSYFTIKDQKRKSFVSALVNLGLLLLFVVIVNISWAGEKSLSTKTVAVMEAGSWISIILSVVLTAYIFNENIFKKIIQKVKK